jgi:hypothetical protein
MNKKRTERKKLFPNLTAIIFTIFFYHVPLGIRRMGQIDRRTLAILCVCVCVCVCVCISVPMQKICIVFLEAIVCGD